MQRFISHQREDGDLIAQSRRFKTLSVEQRDRVAVAGAAAAVAIFQNEARDAKGVQPPGHLMALVVHGKMAISSAGTYHNRGARGLIFGWEVNSQAWLVAVSVALGMRCSVGPEQLSRRGGE